MMPALLEKPTTLMFPHEYRQDLGIISLPLTNQRITIEAEKVQARINNLFTEGTYPLCPDSTFARNGLEKQFSIEEVTSAEYLYIQRDPKTLAEIFESDKGPVIIGSAGGLLDKRNLLLLFDGKIQNEIPTAVLEIANELANKGLTVGMNGLGNSNSKKDFHLQIYDFRGADGHRYCTERMMVVDLYTAPAIYKDFLNQGRFISVAFLGKGKVGFVEQKMPSSFAIEQRPFPHDINVQSLNESEYKYLYIRMWLGLGCLESTTNTIIKKIPELSIEKHLEIYEMFFSKPDEEKEFDFKRFEQIIKDVKFSNHQLVV